MGGVVASDHPTIRNITSDNSDDTYSLYCKGNCSHGQRQADYSPSLQIKVAFTQAVTVTGVPTINFEDHAATASFSGMHATKSHVLLFDYAIPDDTYIRDLKVLNIDLPTGATIVSADDSATARLDLPHNKNLSHNKNLQIDTKPPAGQEYIKYCKGSTEAESHYTTVMHSQCNNYTDETVDGSGDTKWYVRKMLYSGGLSHLTLDDNAAKDLGFKVFDSHPGSCTYQNTVNESPTQAVTSLYANKYEWLDGSYQSIYYQADNGQYVCLYLADKSANVRYQLLAVRGEDKSKPQLTISAVDSNSQVTVGATDPESGINNIQYYRTDDLSQDCDDQSDSFLQILSGSKVTVFKNEKICVRAYNNIIESGMGRNWLALGSAEGSRSRPEISVSPSSDDSSPKTEITVSASSTDTNLGSNPAWTYKLIAHDADCNTAQMTGGSSSGNSVTLNTEAENDHKVCFSVSDTSNNPGYAASGVITGIDRTAPTITVTPDSDDSSPKTTITVSALSDDTDVDSSSWRHKVIAHDADCNATQMSSSYYSGASETLNSEAQNNHKVCFGVKDELGNWEYAASGVITGIFIDRTAPTITVTPSSDDSSPKTTITVSALSDDTDVDSSSWRHKVIAHDADCNTAQMSSSYFIGPSETLNTEAENDHKVCFSVSDTSNNPGYAASGVITGIDRTAPTITVTPDSDDSSPKTAITVSALSDDTDVDSSSWRHKVIVHNADCNATQMTGGSSSGNSVTLNSESDNGKKVCFRVEDNLAHVTYAASGVITGIDRTAPTITSISGDKIDQAYAQGAVIEIIVLLSEALTDLTEPSQLTLSLNSGGTAIYRGSSSPASAPGRNRQLSFNYTVAAGDNTDDLDVTAFNLNQDTVTDRAGNSLDTTLPAGSNLADSSQAIIDTTDPMIDISSLVNNQVSATVTETNLNSFEVQLPTIGSCNSSATGSFTDYNPGDTLTLAESQTVCFKATDTAGNEAYSLSTVGLDLIAPTITVTPSSDDSSPKTAITVSASSTDTNLGSNPAWTYKLIAHDADCNTAQMISGSSSGNSVTLNTEAENNHKVCFSVSDTSNNPGYAASGVITGIDRTAPTITVTPSSDDSSPKTEITVSASSTDTNLGSNPAWTYKLIAHDADCNTAQMTGGSSSGNSVTLNTEAENNHKVCFSVSDTSNNPGYAASGVITGIDRTAPTITVTPDSDDSSPKTTITVSASSTDTNLGSNPAWTYKLIAHDADCNTAQMTGGSSSGNSVTLNTEAENNHKVCFSVSDTSNNPGYAASGVITGIDRTAPTITVTPDSDDSSPKTAITVSASSTDTNLGSNPAWTYKLIAHDADCNTAQMISGSSSGNSVTLNTEAENNHKVCFSVSDTSNNPGYAASGVITGIDRTAPTITVTPDSDDSSQPPEVDQPQPSQMDQPQLESPREPSQISSLSDDEGGSNASVWIVTIVSIIAISITAAITRKPKTRR